jgi:hypothetical protein
MRLALTASPTASFGNRLLFRLALPTIGRWAFRSWPPDDTIERTDPIERLLGDCGAVGNAGIEELPPHVRQACAFRDLVTLAKGIEGGVAISMEHTSERSVIAVQHVRSQHIALQHHNKRRQDRRCCPNPG